MASSSGHYKINKRPKDAVSDSEQEDTYTKQDWCNSVNVNLEITKESMHVIEKPMKKDIYRNGGWLPSKYIMDEWRAPLIQSVQTDIDQKDEFKHRSVKELASIIRNDPNLKDLVDKMIEENKILYNAKSLEKECKIKSGAIPTVEHMFMAIDKILDQGPHWHKGHLVGIPLAALFTGVNATLSGQAVFRNVVFNKALRAVLQEWGDFLDKPESFPRGNEWLTTRGRNSWAGNENEMQWKYELEQDPYWSSWNSFFGRHFADEYYKKYRCIAGPKDPNVIISCNDGTAFRWRDNIKLTDTFWLKDMPYSIQNIFGGEKDEKGYAKRFADKFVGGKIFQTFLNPYNYHRWNSPVKGKIIIADVLKRYYYSKLINPDFDGVSTASCPYLLEVNCRGIVIIDTTGPKEKGYANIGLVCCIPIGMCEVSSIKYDSKIRPSADIEKGQELGYFKFGGSSFAIMFQDTTKYGKELVFLSDHKLGFKGNWGSNIFPRDAPTPQVSGGIGIPVNVNMQIGYLIPSKITTK